MKWTIDCRKEGHRIGQRMLGGFPGHAHEHPTGPQLCLYCDKTLPELFAEIRQETIKDIEKLLKVHLKAGGTNTIQTALALLAAWKEVK